MLHHIELYVSNLNRSKQFWGWLLEDVLNYEKYQEWERGFSFKYESMYIVFVQTEQRFLEPSYHRCRVGLNHLAFQVRNREKVDEITKLLEQRELKILYKNSHPFAGGNDHYAVYFEDPDRIKVEIVAMS